MYSEETKDGDFMSVSREKALEHQKQKLLQKQQSRRGSAGPVYANRSFSGAGSKINSSKPGGSFRNFSAPKFIDPLEGEDDEDDLKFKETGYSKSFMGSSNSFKGPSATSHQVYDDLLEQKSSSSFRVANMQESESFHHPNEIESKTASTDRPTQQVKNSSSRKLPSAAELEESKVEQELQSRGIASSFDPETLSSSKKASIKKKKKKSVESESESEDDVVSEEEPAIKKKSIKKKKSEKKQPEKRESKVEEPPIGKRDGKLPNNIPSPLENEEDNSLELKETFRDAGASLNFSDMRSLVNQPIRRNQGTVQCYIERNKSGTSKLYPEYHLFLKDGDRFLMAGKKKPKNRTSNYVISFEAKDLKKDSPHFLGKLRANFLGTEFQIFDKGANPKSADPNALKVKGTKVREELGVVLYASNVLGSRGPRKMKAAVPLVDDEGERKHASHTEMALSRFKDRDMNDLIELVNKPPRWNDNVGAYVLNFNGRVTMASVKNFQLITPDDEDSIVLQFGRVGKDLFTMDFAWPLSPMQAFTICLSSFDGKLACE